MSEATSAASSSGPVLTVDELAAELCVDPRMIEVLAAHDLIGSFVIGNSRRILRQSIPGDLAALAALKATTKLLSDVASVMSKLDKACDPQGVCIGWLYAIRCDAVGLTKIGKAINPMTRIADLARMNAAPLILVGLAHDQRAEFAVHRKFSRNRAHGEWFAINENPLPFDGTCVTCRGHFK